MLHGHARRALHLTDHRSLFLADRAGVVALLDRLEALAPGSLGHGVRDEVRGLATGLACFYPEGELIGRVRDLADADGAGLDSPDRDSLRTLITELDGLEARAHEPAPRARPLRATGAPALGLASH